MKKKETEKGGNLLPVLLCCMLLACAGLVFAVYTHRELSWLKTQIREHEKLIQTLQLHNKARDIQVRTFCLHSLVLTNLLPPGFYLFAYNCTHQQFFHHNCMPLNFYVHFRDQRQSVFGRVPKILVLVLVSGTLFCYRTPGIGLN